MNSGDLFEKRKSTVLPSFERYEQKRVLKVLLSALLLINGLRLYAGLLEPALRICSNVPSMSFFPCSPMLW